MGWSLSNFVAKLSASETRILVALILGTGAAWAFLKLTSEFIFERESALDQRNFMIRV